jgi:lipoprotein signal peptidase
MALSLPQAHLKRSMPSLIGGIFSGIVVFALWLLLFGTGSVAMIALGLILAGALGTWIRLADL